MRSERDTQHHDGGSLDAEIARLRRETDAIEPAPGLTAAVMARVASRAVRSSPVTMGATPPNPGSGLPPSTWWAQLSPVGRRFVPVATLAAAAALALAWSVQSTLDETALSALDTAQDLP